MKRIIYNNVIPFRGYKAMALWPFVFVRSKYEDGGMADKDIRHETIHLRQQAEMLVLPFLLWYMAEWCVRLMANRFRAHAAYRSIGFEQEAYANERNEAYLANRKHYAWWRYFKKGGYDDNKDK